MKAVKANKVYTINEIQQAGYIAQGFDIIDDDGETIAYGRGKTVPYAEYEALKAELEKMRPKKPEKRGKKGAEDAEEQSRDIVLEAQEKEGV